MLCLCTQMQAQEHQMTTEQAKSYYKSVSKKVTSCHDPSVVYEPSSKRYYIFGSHMSAAPCEEPMSWERVADGYTTSNPVYGPIYDVQDKELD